MRESTNTAWIVTLLLVLLCLVGVSALISLSAADLQQTVTDVSLTEQILAKLQSILDLYGWSLAGVLASPIIVFRAVQYAKKAAKSAHKPLNRWVMDGVSTLAVFLLSYLFLAQDGGGLQTAIVAGVIASLHTVIVKAVFRFAPEKVAAVLTDGVYVDDRTTFAGRTVAAVVGKRGDMRSESRGPDTEDITQDKTQLL